MNQRAGARRSLGANEVADTAVPSSKFLCFHSRIVLSMWRECSAEVVWPRR